MCLLSFIPVTLLNLLVSPFGSHKILNAAYLKGDDDMLQSEKYDINLIS